MGIIQNWCQIFKMYQIVHQLSQHANHCYNSLSKCTFSPPLGSCVTMNRLFWAFSAMIGTTIVIMILNNIMCFHPTIGISTGVTMDRPYWASSTVIIAMTAKMVVMRKDAFTGTKKEKVNLWLDQGEDNIHYELHTRVTGQAKAPCWLGVS